MGHVRLVTDAAGGGCSELVILLHPLRDDAVIVSVSNHGDEKRVLRWCALRASDSGVHLGPDIHETPLRPGDGATFLLERGGMPASGVRWTRLQAFDDRGRHATAPIPRPLSKCLEAPSHLTAARPDGGCTMGPLSRLS